MLVEISAFKKSNIVGMTISLEHIGSWAGYFLNCEVGDAYSGIQMSLNEEQIPKLTHSEEDFWKRIGSWGLCS